MIDLAWIQRLIEMIEASDIDSLEISRWGTRVRVAKSPTVQFGGVAGSLPSAQATDGIQPQAAAATPVAETPAPAPPEPEPDNLVEVVSPMVGTFYRAPAPDAPAYVDNGDKISKGQTLCILEAMKLMNELEAEVSGTIREICVENAEPVEYGQVLFRVEPA